MPTLGEVGSAFFRFGIPIRMALFYCVMSGEHYFPLTALSLGRLAVVCTTPKDIYHRRYEMRQLGKQHFKNENCRLCAASAR
jgi:hypothetical protein